VILFSVDFHDTYLLQFLFLVSSRFANCVETPTSTRARAGLVISRTGSLAMRVGDVAVAPSV